MLAGLLGFANCLELRRALLPKPVLCQNVKMMSWLAGLWRRFFSRSLPTTGQTPDELARLIRDLMAAMDNLRGPESSADREFVEQHFSRAILGLLDLGRADQAAVLCKKAPATHRLPFRKLLEGIDEQVGLKLAIACMRKEDWSTSLRLLDWALGLPGGSKSKKKIFNVAFKIARNILHQDPATFQAKIITLQLSPAMSDRVLAAGRQAG